jgi:hypothetical protein
MGKESRLKLSVRARTTGGEFACHVEEDLAVTEIGLFQFAIMSVPDAHLMGHADRFRVQGRLHSNNHVYMGARAGTSVDFESVTATAAVHSSALGSAYGRDRYAFSPPTLTHATLHDIDLPTEHARVNGKAYDLSGGTGDWTNLVVKEFGGVVLGRGHGVTELKIPGLNTKDMPPVQASRPNPAFASHPLSSMRALVEPVSATGNTVQERHTLAFKADIRIIDGMWYVRDPTQPLRWPGLPIWSDHAGAVDQGVRYDLRGDVLDAAPKAGTIHMKAMHGASMGWKKAGAPIPRRYSYYAAEESGRLLIDSDKAGQPRAVISYGVLARTGAGSTATRGPGLHADTAGPSSCV